MTGKYKGYDYWIDKEYKVHIGTKDPKALNVEMDVTYVGTSACTIEVNATSGYGEVVKYEYKVNNEVKKETTESTITIEELNPTTKYTIEVTATDEKENVETSFPIKITTKERTYLYKEGNEYVELTGGWQRGNYNIGEFTKKGNCMNLYADIPAGPGTFWNSCETINAINLSGYKKICYKFKIANEMILDSDGVYQSWTYISICKPRFESYGDYNFIHRSYIGGLEDISNKVITKPINITNENETAYPSIILAKQYYQARYEADVDIYEVWLEK